MHKKLPELKPLFVERMKKLLPEPSDFGRYKKILNEPILRSIRCNTLKISPDELKTRLEKKGWKIKQPWSKNPEVMIVEGKFVSKNLVEKGINKDELLTNNKSVSKANVVGVGEQLHYGMAPDREVGLRVGRGADGRLQLHDLSPGELGRALEHQLGYYYIQELASMLPVLILNPQPKETILDLCASPGSKTTQIASKMENNGILIANEVSLPRIKILASNLERCGATNTVITRKEGAALSEKLEKEKFLFDKILVDAPCSGEGTLRSTPKTALMWNIKTVKHLPRIQSQLIESALKVLKPNGILVYSTCTHAPEENEGVLDFTLNKFPNVKIESVKLPIKCRSGLTRWEGNNYNKEVNKCCRIYPQDANTEGFFLAKLRKRE